MNTMDKKRKHRRHMKKKHVYFSIRNNFSHYYTCICMEFMDYSGVLCKTNMYHFSDHDV